MGEKYKIRIFTVEDIDVKQNIKDAVVEIKSSVNGFNTFNEIEGYLNSLNTEKVTMSIIVDCINDNVIVSELSYIKDTKILVQIIKFALERYEKSNK